MAGILDDITAERSNVLDGIAAGTPTSPQDRDNFNRIASSRVGELRKGLRRAGYNTSSTVDAAVGQFAEPFAPDFAERQFAKAAATQRNMPSGLEAETPSFRDVDDLESAASFGAGALGEGLTSVAGIVAGGVAARLGLGSALRLGATGKNVAQYAGGAAAMFPQEAGETALTLRNNPEAMANTTPWERTGLSAGKGFIASAMESIVPNLVFANAIAGTARRIAPGAASAAANVGRKALGGTLGEFATEGSQELAGQVAENIAVPGTGYDFEQALEAGVKGSVTGGVLGSVGGGVQAVRSNIDAAADTAREKGGPAAQEGLNRAVAGLDNILRNPEQFGVDLTNTTMGALAEASSRARDLGVEVADRAGPAAAQGMDAIAALRDRFDRAVAGQLTPENRKKYVDLTKNFRLLQPSEYAILNEAFATGDAARINRAVGAASRKFADRVPRETLDGIKNFVSWTKRFGAGVTNAARERKASVLRYGLPEVTAFGSYLQENQPELTNFFLASQTPTERLQSVRALMAVRDGNVSPKQMDELQGIMQASGLSLSEIAKDIRSSAARAYITRERQPAPTPLTAREEQKAWRYKDSQIATIGERAENLLVGDELAAQAEREGVDPSTQDTTGSTYDGEDGTRAIPSNNSAMADAFGKAAPIYTAENLQIDVEDIRNSAFSGLGQVQRVLAADRISGRPFFSESAKNDTKKVIPSVLRAKTEDKDGNEVVITPVQIAQLLQGKDSVRNPDRADKKRKYIGKPIPLTEEEITGRVTEDGGYRQGFNGVDIAGQAGLPEERGGSLEAMEKFVPAYDPKDNSLKAQGYRMLAGLMSLKVDGIDIPRSDIPPALLAEWGMDAEGANIHMDVDIDLENLSPELQVQVGDKNSTIADLLGMPNDARSLGSQLQLLEKLQQGDLFTPSVSVSKALNRLRADDETADATSKGLWGFVKNKRERENVRFSMPKGFDLDQLLDEHVPLYIANLIKRLNDSEANARKGRDLNRLYDGLKSKFFEPAEVKAIIDLFDSDAVEQTPEDTAAMQWVYGLELEAQGNDELHTTLVEFSDNAMRKAELRQEEFEASAVEPKPLTPEEELDIYRKAEKGETNLRNAGMDKQKDAEVRLSTPMTVAHQRRIAETLPTKMKALVDEQVPFLYDPSVQQLEFDLSAPLRYDGRDFLDLEHIAKSYKTYKEVPVLDEDGKPTGEVTFEKVAEDRLGKFSQKDYDAYPAKFEAMQAEAASLRRMKRDEEYDDLSRLDTVDRPSQAPVGDPTATSTPAPTYPVTPVTGVEESLPGWSQELHKALQAATTAAEIEAVRKEFTAKKPKDSAGNAGINQTAIERWHELRQQKVKDAFLEFSERGHIDDFKKGALKLAAAARAKVMWLISGKPVEPKDATFKAFKEAVYAFLGVPRGTPHEMNQAVTEAITGTQEQAKQTQVLVQPKQTGGGSIVTAKYTPQLLRAQPNTLFIFGDNLEGRGKGGQAVIRDEPNAFGIPTKRKPSMGEDAFFSDRPDEIAAVQQKLASLEGRNFNWPAASIGTGLAQLQRRSPKIAKLIDEWAQQNVAAEQKKPTKKTRSVVKPVREEAKAKIEKPGVLKRGKDETDAEWQARFNAAKRQQAPAPVEAPQQAPTDADAARIKALQDANELFGLDPKNKAELEALKKKTRSVVTATREEAAPATPTGGALTKNPGESQTDFMNRMQAHFASKPKQSRVIPPVQTAKTQIEATTTEEALDTLWGKLISDGNERGITLEEADNLSQLYEAQLDRIKETAIDVFINSLKDGTGLLGPDTIRQRAVNNWTAKYLSPGAQTKVLALDGDNLGLKYYLERKGRETNAAGGAYPGSTLNITGDGINYVGQSITKGADKLGDMSILAHEFGHIIQYEMHYADKVGWAAVDALYMETTDADFGAGMSATRMFAGRKALYDQVEAGTMSAEDAVAKARKGKADYLGINSVKALYETNFPEWFAENFAKYALNETSVFDQGDATVKNHLNRIIAKMKRFYNEVIKKNFTPNKTFTDYIESLAARREEIGSDPARAENIKERVGKERARETARKIAAMNDSAKQQPAAAGESAPVGPDDNIPPPSDGAGVGMDANTPPPERGTSATPPGGTPPPPPQGPPRSGGQTPPPNDVQKELIADVEKMLGKGRLNFEFDANLPPGVAGEYVSRQGEPLEDTYKALKAVTEKRAEALREAKRIEKILASRTHKKSIDEIGDPAAFREVARLLEAEEQRYRADVAIRGTFRVAAGMEKQAGLREHEAFHAAFDFFFGDNNKADRAVLVTAFTRGLLSRRLIKYFAGNAEVLAVIDPSNVDTFRAEEAAAYAFQVYIHDPGALQMGEKVEGIFNQILAYLQKLVGYQTYEQRAQIIFNDLKSGDRAERGVSILRTNPNIEKSILENSQEFARRVGKGAMNLYDALLTSSYDRLAESGNPAMAQIGRLGYNETGERGQGMLQLERLKVTQFSNQMKDALHMLDANEIYDLGQAMLLEKTLDGKLGAAQERLSKIYKEAHEYQVAAGIDLGFEDNYYPMIWDPEKVAADRAGFIKMLEGYPVQMAELMQTADQLADNIMAYTERGHEFQGVFNTDGEPVADSSKRRTLDFITVEDRVKYMEDDLIETTAHYLNQAVRHAEYVRAYGEGANRLKSLLSEITDTYGGTGADVALAKDYIDGLMGNKEVGMSRELKDLYGAAVVYQNVRLLPLTSFSSLVDPLGIAVRTNSATAVFDTFAYSMRNLFTDFRNKLNWTPEKWEQYAGDIGTVDMSGTVKSIDKIFTGMTLRGKTREINDGFFKWNLLNGLVKNHHIMATKYAELYLRRNADGMFEEKMAAENLQEVGLSREDIVYDEALGRIKTFSYEIAGYESMEAMEQGATAEEITEAKAQADRIQQAIHKIVRESLIQPSSASAPGWMSNPYLAPIAHLKTFVFGFKATIIDRLIYEAQRGNYSPLYYAAAYVPGMIAADFIKGFAGNGGEEPEWKKNWTFGDYLWYGVERSGLLGTGQFFLDMNNDVTRGGGGFETLSGPTIEQGIDLMGALNAKTSRPTQTWMIDALPANAVYNQWMKDN